MKPSEPKPRSDSMFVASVDSIVGDASVQVPQRPTWPLSVVLDGSLAVISYFVAYWLRFEGDRLETFLPNAWSTFPLVVIVQSASLMLSGAYGRWHRIDWLLRVVGGIVVGTAIAAASVWLTTGFQGVSRFAFVADAVLLVIGTIAWRGVWVMRQRARIGFRERADELVDRAEEMTTFRGVVASLYSYRELLKNLVLKDLKLKYRGSVFGFLWSLANPLLMVVVYTLAFNFILRIRSATFVFSLLLGQLSWTFFASSATMSTGAIVDNAGLLKSVLFPRAILPIGVVLFNLAQYLLTIAVFLPAMLLWYRVPLTLPMLGFPAVLALQVVFTIGIALALATATAFFRDVRHLLEVALAVLFWSTPILYEFAQVPERLRLLILFSPLSSFVVSYQQMFIHQHWPQATVWVVAATQAFGAFAGGALIFLAFDDRFTEQL